MNTTHMHIPSNRVRDIERYFLSELEGLYSPEELHTFVYMLFEAFLGWDKTHFLLHRDETINQSDLLRFHWAAEDLKQFRPIQHLIGYTDFCNTRIKVSPHVLIPRPETEEIVNHILGIPAFSPHAILDLCTGSGCIAIALKKHFPQATVIGVDLSDKALAMARDNATLNNAAVTFIQMDILNQRQLSSLTQTFDLIISNPPYVMQNERDEMRPNVLDHEPPQALFAPDDNPMLFYSAIATYASAHLSKDGLLVTEINEHHGETLKSLYSSAGLQPTLYNDFRGKDRYIIAQSLQSHQS